jgi:hypothetical protein
LRIDKTHKNWAYAMAGLTAVAIAIYVVAQQRHFTGAFGGTGAGLFFGVCGLALIIFHNLLSLRKRFPVWRIGKSQTWLRAHLWFGVLTVPVVIFHTGFVLGGRLSALTFWLSMIVIASGFVGATLQHFMPRLMTQRVPMETIYDQIDRVQGQLLAEADGLIEDVEATAAKSGVLLFKNEETGAAAVATVATTLEPFEELRSVYKERLRPFLAKRGDYRSPLYQRSNAKGLFFRLRKLIPKEVHVVLDDLENICEEKRDLDRQSRMHRVLHGWLLVHVPLAYGLLILVIVHAISAIRYL